MHSADAAAAVAVGSDEGVEAAAAAAEFDFLGLAYDDQEQQQPNVTVIGNTTYCWDEELQSYTWCQTEQLYTVPLSILLLLSACYGAISLVAIFGNLLVIGVVVFAQSMRSVTNLYIANLASADVIIAVFCIPFQFYAALLQRWDLPEFMCKFCPFTQTLSVNVSIFTLVTISIDRYRAIMSPLSERSSDSSAKAMILGLWTFSVLLALPMYFFFEFTEVFDEINGGMKPFCTLGALTLQEQQQRRQQQQLELLHHHDLEILASLDDRGEGLFAAAAAVTGGDDDDDADDVLEPGPFQRISTFQMYNFVLSIVQYVLPLFVISFAYMRMGVKLWLTRTPGAAQVKRDQMILNNKKKTIKMLLIVVSIFGICWMPWHFYQISMILFPDINQYHYINIVFFISHWLAMSNSCYNPFIYAIYSEKFKREFREWAYCKCCSGGGGSSSGGIEDRHPGLDFCLADADAARRRSGTINSIRSQYVLSVKKERENRSLINRMNKLESGESCRGVGGGGSAGRDVEAAAAATAAENPALLVAIKYNVRKESLGPCLEG